MPEGCYLTNNLFSNYYNVQENYGLFVFSFCTTVEGKEFRMIQIDSKDGRIISQSTIPGTGGFFGTMDQGKGNFLFHSNSGTLKKYAEYSYYDFQSQSIKWNTTINFKEYVETREQIRLYEGMGFVEVKESTKFEIIAFDSNQEKWRISTDRIAPFKFWNGNLYLMLSGPKITIIDAKSGSIIKEYDFEESKQVKNRAKSKILVDNSGDMYFGYDLEHGILRTKNFFMMKYSNTGKKIWKTELKDIFAYDYVYGKDYHLIGNDIILSSTESKFVIHYSLNRLTGEINWMKKIKSEKFCSIPILFQSKSKDYLFTDCQSDGAYILELSNGNIIQKIDGLEEINHKSHPFFGDGIMYCLDTSKAEGTGTCFKIDFTF